MIEFAAWWRLPQKIRFLLVGGYNTVFGYLVFAGLYALLSNLVHYLLIALLSHFISVINAFVLHRRLVFRASGAWQASFVRFNVSQLVAVGAGTLGLYLLVEFGRFNPLVAQALVTTVAVFITYSLHRFYSFRQSD